jgi:hypothetical protein
MSLPFPFLSETDNETMTGHPAAGNFSSAGVVAKALPARMPGLLTHVMET